MATKRATKRSSATAAASSSSSPGAVAPMKKFSHLWKPPDSTTWRGIYRWEDEEHAEWKAALAEFAYKVPSFASKAEAIAFIKAHCRVGSNRDHRLYQHMFSLLTTWEQLNKHLVAKIAHYDQVLAGAAAARPALPPLDPSRNVWLQPAPADDPDLNVGGVVAALDQRLGLPFHRHLSAPSTINTLKYLFEHMRCGIFVKIKAGQLVMFVPFANDAYTNTWAGEMEFDSADGTMETYFQEKMKGGFRKENILPNVAEWWANGNMIDNEKVKAGTDKRYGQVWGDFFLCQLKEMLQAACHEREVADCEFFINKRDYPHLKTHHEADGDQVRAVEPYGFIYGKDDRDPAQDVPLARHAYFSYAPLASFYISSRFADIPWPTTEDWEAATGRVYPHTFMHRFDAETDELVLENEPRDLFTEVNFQKFSQVAWADKVPTAFFRGTATGGGTKIDTNQRLKLAHLSHLWGKDGFYNGQENEDFPVPYLDAALTGWNMRDKKIASEPMTFIKKKDFVFKVGKTNFVPIYEQAKYKYLLYVEGHCAACRYSFLMRLGSVILKVESRCVADEMWYFPLLRPFVDHVPVKADMSDLDEQIQWCRDHDAECQQIAANARKLYDTFCAKEGILDYLQLVTHKIAARWHKVPAWWQPSPLGFARPQMGGADGGGGGGRGGGGGPPHQGGDKCSCRRCTEDRERASRAAEAKARLNQERKSRALQRREAEDAARKKLKVEEEEAAAANAKDGEDEDEDEDDLRGGHLA